jgi:hypothetical protein
MLNFLLDFPMPCFNVVGCSRAFSVEVIPNSMVAFNTLGYDVVCKPGGRWHPNPANSETMRPLLGVQEQVAMQLHV